MGTLSSLDQEALKKLGSRETSVSSFVDEIAKGGVGRDDAVKAVMSLRDGKRITLMEAKPYASLFSYATSPLSVWFWGTLGAVVVSVALITVTSGVVIYARYVFGSALVLFLPGYALIEALYPKRELDELTRFALSIGLSLAIVPLTGLVLNYTPFGIRLLPVTLSIAGLTIALLLVSLKRRHDYYRLAKGIT